MTTLSSRFLTALAFALVAGGITSVQAVTIAPDAAPDITIYKPLGFAFGYTTGTPSNLFGGFGGGGGGGGGGGFASGGMVPPLNFGGGGNSLVAPNGGSGGASGSFANGGGNSQGNVGPEGSNFLAGPSGGGGSFGGTSSGPVPVFQNAAPNVQGETPAPFVLAPQNGESAVSVPDSGIGALGFSFVLALFALLSPLRIRATANVRAK